MENNSTTNTTDSSFPSTASVTSYLGPIGALLACCLGGLTGFGDAIALHILWAIAGVVGLVSNNRRDVLAKAVTITAIMSLANTPLGLYVARKDLRKMFPYALVTACTGIPMVIVGIQLLFFADLTSLKIFVGLFFLMFALGKLTSSVLSIAREKLQTYLQAKKTTVISSSVSTISTDTAVLNESSIETSIIGENNTVDTLSTGTSNSTSIPTDNNYGQQGWTPSLSESPLDTSGGGEVNVISTVEGNTSSVSSLPSTFPWLHRFLGTYVEPSSPKYTVPTTLFCCFIAGSGAGLLNGLLGTGGPPQMIAYSILEFNKDTIRAMSSLYGALELPLRCYFMFAGEGNVFNKDDYAEYIGVAVASWTGFSIGTALRKYVNTSSIIRILLMLVFASSSILLGALDHPGVAITYIIGGLLWIGLLWLLWYRYYWTMVQNGIVYWDQLWLILKQYLARCIRGKKS